MVLYKISIICPSRDKIKTECVFLTITRPWNPRIQEIVSLGKYYFIMTHFPEKKNGMGLHTEIHT